MYFCDPVDLYSRRVTCLHPIRENLALFDGEVLEVLLVFPLLHLCLGHNLVMPISIIMVTPHFRYVGLCF